MPSHAPRSPRGDWLGTPYLKFERHGSVARVVVDRPQARNALTAAMYYGVKHAVRVVNADPSLSGLLITGTGDVFIPGGDLGKDAGDNWFGEFDVELGMDVLPFDSLRHSVKPVVSAVNGICQGGGFMIALCSDLAVVSERATFRVPELLRGISDMYFIQMLLRVVGPVRARDLMLSARVLSAEEAVDWGLVSRVVPHEEVEAAAAEQLRAVLRTAPGARRDIKRAIDQHVGLFDRMSMIDSLRGAESAEGYAAFMQKRPPSWASGVSVPRERHTLSSDDV